MFSAGGMRFAPAEGESGADRLTAAAEGREKSDGSEQLTAKMQQE